MSKKCRKIYNFNPIIKRLCSEDDEILRNFNAGKKKFAFNNFIKKEAKNDMTTGDGVTYLVIDEKLDGSECLVAYYTISTCSINIVDRYDFEDDEIPEEEKREHFSPISSFYINMFAVDVNYQDAIYDGQLISALILKYIINELRNMSMDVIGAKMITLCSVPDAIKFYEDNSEFEELTSKYTLLDKADAKYENKPMKLVLHKI